MFEKTSSVPNSIEKLVVDSNELEITTAKFLSDPIVSLELIRDEVLQEHQDMSGVALVAVDMLESVRSYTKDMVANASDIDMQAYLDCDDADPVLQNQCIVALLQRAGYSRSEVMAWAKVSDDTLSPLETLQSRSAVVIVNQKYGTE